MPIELLYTATRHDDGRMTGQCQIRPATPQLQALIDVIASAPGDPARLLDSALHRRGYENSDGGFGLEYCPPASVRIYTFRGPPDGAEFSLPETLYLDVLELWLFLRGVNPAALRRPRPLA